MNRNHNPSQSNLYYVLDGRKRRQIDSDSSREDSLYSQSKRPPKTANGNGEILTAPGQNRHQIKRFREQITYVSNAVMKDNPAVKWREDHLLTSNDSRNPRYDIATDDVLDDDIIGEEEFVFEPTGMATTSSREADHPYFVVVHAPERQIMTSVDPTICTDVTTLQESLMHANECILEMQEQQKKLKSANSMLRARYNNELNRSDDFQRILLERNLRMKQIVSENVRWNVRYSRLKQHFGDEDIASALGELAPK